VVAAQPQGDAVPPAITVALPARLEALAGDRIRASSPRQIKLATVGSSVPDLAGCEVLLHGFWWNDPPLEEIVAAMPDLRWLHSTGAGLDDVVAADIGGRDLLITNAAGAYAPAMAEYALAAMVFLARGFGRWVDAQRSATWLERTDATGSTLHGKQVGIVGYGSVGRHLAAACKALGMTVWATRRTPGFVSAEPLDRLLPSESLPEMLAVSDFVVVAASLNATTRGILDAETLAAVKPGAFLVNVARGGLMDQNALADALRSGRLGGAVLDVTDPEPLPADDALWRLPSVIITPHVSGDTEDGWNRSIELFCANLGLFAAGSPGSMGNRVSLSSHA
jgi:phosphoglycerate dehydrogenase-like enzyme